MVKDSYGYDNPGYTTTYKYDIEQSNRTSVKSPQLFSDTVDPFGNQSVFLPKINFSFPASVRIKPTYPSLIEYAPIKIPQQIPLYVEYTASPSAHVEIFSDIGVSNSGKKNTMRMCGMIMRIILIGTAPVHLMVGRSGMETVLRLMESLSNLSHPLWQNVLNGTASEM